MSDAEDAAQQEHDYRHGKYRELDAVRAERDAAVRDRDLARALLECAVTNIKDRTRLVEALRPFAANRWEITDVHRAAALVAEMDAAKGGTT